jgi:uncharacterized protein YcfJ
MSITPDPNLKPPRRRKSDIDLEAYEAEIRQRRITGWLYMVGGFVGAGVSAYLGQVLMAIASAGVGMYAGNKLPYKDMVAFIEKATALVDRIRGKA